MPFENLNAQKSNLIKEVIFSYYSQGNLYRQTQIYMQMKSWFIINSTQPILNNRKPIVQYKEH